jgi:DNA polymerase elongation subunit (family B)
MAKQKAVKSVFADGLKKADVVLYSPHLMTLGAYVQKPNPQIIGLSNFEVIGSQDAKSLYPTIMVLMNIGYDTLRGRIYDMSIVGNMLNIIRQLHSLPLDRIKERTSSIHDLDDKLPLLA